MSAPTPRTDDEESRFDYSIIPHERHYAVNASFARQLERELEELNEWKKGKKGIEDYYIIREDLHKAQSQLTAHKSALVKAREELGFVGITKGNADAIVWHLKEGYDNGSIGKDALASFIGDMAMRMDEALTAINEALNDGPLPAPNKEQSNHK